MNYTKMRQDMLNYAAKLNRVYGQEGDTKIKTQTASSEAPITLDTSESTSELSFELSI